MTDLEQIKKDMAEVSDLAAKSGGPHQWFIRAGRIWARDEGGSYEVLCMGVHESDAHYVVALNNLFPRLAQLVEEVERLRGIPDTAMRERAEAAERRVRELEEALRPFANVIQNPRWGWTRGALQRLHALGREPFERARAILTHKKEVPWGPV